MILVTGGTGLLGTHVLFQLANSGKSIRAIKRASSDIQLVEKVFNHYSSNGSEIFNAIEWVEADIINTPSLESVFHGIDEVYHCAAIVSFNKRDYNQMMKVNREGTANMVNFALANNVKKFCHVSSTAAIGKTGLEKINTEKNKWVQGPETSGYAITKYSAEKEVWRAHEEGLNVCIVNPSVILGPGNIEESSNTIFNNVKKGLKYYTDGVNAMCDARDVANVMQRLMDENVFGERFLCFTENISFKELTTKMAHAFGTKPPYKKANPFLVGLAWRFEAFRTKLFGGTPKLTKENAVSADSKSYYSHDKIVKHLNYSFFTMDDTIKNAVSYYKSN